ncbi:MAG: GIY-YIG nuclease family protein [Paludibacter sp.]|nr:GIY-YIG nuclease family protein [Paludibacter sp.]
MAGSYIIFSEKLNKFYIGATHEDVSLSIEKHNQSAYGKHKFTATADDWELVLFIPANDFAHAIRIEKKIKSMKSSLYIRNLTKYPNLLEKLVSST